MGGTSGVVSGRSHETSFPPLRASRCLTGDEDGEMRRRSHSTGSHVATENTEPAASSIANVRRAHHTGDPKPLEQRFQNTERNFN